MNNAHIPILGFAAFSGTGKTTLLTKLIPLLKNKGLRVGLIKHSHHNFDIDKPGKDSYRLREAGATPVMLVSSHRRAIITEFSACIEPKLEDQLIFYDQTELDLILVEGFKTEQFPKIELHRPSLQKKLLFPVDPDIIAIATDSKINPNCFPTSLSALQISALQHPPILDINNPEMISDFILNSFLRNKHD
ncbi:MAG: molybdopterin-guanine dinucleotide biosynthesis protein B [Methylococcaceae bacterium]|nr:molybdopterin-guanine dinucleotide biosynthesis protein B [Methylococcaceae bacterium]